MLVTVTFSISPKERKAIEKMSGVEGIGSVWLEEWVREAVKDVLKEVVKQGEGENGKS